MLLSPTCGVCRHPSPSALHVGKKGEFTPSGWSPALRMPSFKLLRLSVAARHSCSQGYDHGSQRDETRNVPGIPEGSLVLLPSQSPPTPSTFVTVKPFFLVLNYLRRNHFSVVWPFAQHCLRFTRVHYFAFGFFLGESYLCVLLSVPQPVSLDHTLPSRVWDGFPGPFTCHPEGLRGPSTLLSTNPQGYPLWLPAAST